jgi:hypothetical protein
MVLRITLRAAYSSLSPPRSDSYKLKTPRRRADRLAGILGRRMPHAPCPLLKT